ncbi:MAG: hypothetical protein ACJ74H_02115 [Thermoanaerobaculia bacterium]
MSFILRIFFSGLIAFVPSEDGKRVTVFLLDASHAQHATAGGAVPEHRAVLVARAGACDGLCSRAGAGIAQFLYPDYSTAAAVESLQRAAHNGVVWPLAGSDLHVNMPEDGVKLAHTRTANGKSAPDSAIERADFRWVPNLKEIDPSIGSLDPALFGKNPPEELIVARLELTSGEIFTRSVIQVGGKVMPIVFQADATEPPRYMRAAASWVEAEIKIPGRSLTINEETFAGAPSRTVTLAPESNGVLELAVLNISRPVLPVANTTPQPGTHFTRYWDLAAKPPAATERPIPRVTTERRRESLKAWDPMHPATGREASVLLSEIFRGSRGPYDQILCPMSQYPRP